MAVTITRTAWIDDDGSGTYGTVINNAEKTLLYNQIDAALAQLLPLTPAAIQVSGSPPTLDLINTGQPAGQRALRVVNWGGNSQIFSMNETNGAALGGLVNLALDHVGGVQVGGRLSLTGGAGANQIFVNMTTDYFSAKINAAADPTISNGIMMQNLSASIAGLQFFICLNSAGSIIGGIVGASQTSVTFNTTSDARLKHDLGLATDLRGLRAVVVHDFTWKTDGVRDRGVFAQDTHSVFPRAVTVGSDDTTPEGALAKPWQTDYSKFVADLIVGWQQHDAELERLRADLAALKGLH
jgi:hypothetical protein